jgi:hypothetical protein
LERHKVIHPDPKTDGDLKLALSGYEDSLELLTPCDVFICREKGGPFKMEIKHK